MILGLIFILQDRALIFGRLTCFDMKSIIIGFVDLRFIFEE